MTTTSSSFVELLRSSGFIGQEELVAKCIVILDDRSFFNCRNLRALTIRGCNGCGKKTLAKAFGTFLKLDICYVDASAFISPIDIEANLALMKTGIVCVKNADDLDDKIVRLFLKQSWDLDNNLATPDRRLRVIFLKNYWAESYDGSSHNVRFEEYMKTELVEIGLRHVSKWSLSLSEEDILCVLKAKEPTWESGALVTTEMVSKRWSSQQPGAILSALDEISDMGLPAWLDLHKTSVILTAIRGSKSPQTTKEIPTFEALSGQAESNETFRASLMRLSGTEFEKVMGSLLVNMGFKIAWSSPGKDGGIDIVANSVDLLTGGKFLFQCKRYQEQTKIGRPVLQEFCGAAHHDRQHPRLVFVTTSSFTAEAKDYAQKVGMRPISYEELRLLFEKQGRGTIPKLQVGPPLG